MSPRHPSPLRVLLVEDEAADALVLEHALAHIGIPANTVVRASSLVQALPHLSDPAVGLAIVDLGLPDSSGPATVRTLREHNPDLPLIVISGAHEAANALASLKEGADDYLVKGAFDTETLERAIRHSIERRKLWVEARRRAVAVERAERRLRTVVEANTDGMLIVDAEGSIRFANEAATRLLASKGQTLDGVRLGVPVAIQDEPAELDSIRADGSPGKLEMRRRAIEWEGRPAHLLVIRDVTEHRLLEERIRQSQKLEALGKLTGGIAHDFNNVLAVILNATDNLSETIPRTFTEAHQELREIDRYAKRAAGMVRRLLGFSRKEFLRFETVDLRAFTEDALVLMRRVLDDRVALETDVDSGVGYVRADPAALQQIFLNIVANARDAMPGGGTFRVDVRGVDLDRSHKARYPWIVPGRYECVSLSDTGSGMSSDVLSRVFEPFFTTKGPDEGTGLGMAMVYGLMKQHRGLVHVYSQPGKGARVDLFFPNAAVGDRPMEPRTEAVQGRTASEPKASGGAARTLLVVEDEPALRRAMERILRTAGYEVLTAADGAEGLQVWREHQGDIELVISDLVMPKLGGREVLAGLRAEGARCPFLLVTGYGAASVEELRAGGVPMLTKPWTREALLAAVREALQPSGGKRHLAG
jgi:two-component system, cell cycle sensor histidine kinase and response regulator CckA